MADGFRIYHYALYDNCLRCGYNLRIQGYVHLCVLHILFIFLQLLFPGQIHFLPIGTISVCNTSIKPRGFIGIYAPAVHVQPFSKPLDSDAL